MSPRYTSIAIAFHWAIAILMITNILVAWRMTGQPPGPGSFALYQFHKSVGITVLMLTLGRIAWRVGHRPPPYSIELPRWQRVTAGITHWGFYVLMLGLPLSGWALVSASPFNIPTFLYGTIPWPHIPPLAALDPASRKSAADAAEAVHSTLAWIAYLLIALHVAAALKHHFFEGRTFLFRMWPRRPRPTPPEDSTDVISL